MNQKRNLFEMMNKVAKMPLNENLNNDELDIQFNSLLNNTLSVKNTSTRLDGDVTYVTIDASENENSIEFIFKVGFNEEEQSGVYEIADVKLKSFKIESPEGNIDLNDDDLEEFNQTYKNNLISAVENYVDVESDVENKEEDELYENAINVIENIQINRQELKHEKLNPDKIIEDIFKNLSSEKKHSIISAIDNLMRKDKDFSNLSGDEYLSAAAHILGNVITRNLENMNESK